MKPKVAYELGQTEDGKWWCRDKSRPGLIVSDDGKGNQFDFPYDALEACCAASGEYDDANRSRKKPK